jgi:Ion transport protein
MYNNVRRGRALFFAAELTVRLAVARLGFFRSPWGVFDAAVILLAFLPVLGDSITILRMARLARSAHLLRHVSHLRLWRVLRVDAVLRHARGPFTSSPGPSVL